VLLYYIFALIIDRRDLEIRKSFGVAIQQISRIEWIAMPSKAGYLAVILLAAGLAIGIFGAVTPVSATTQSSVTLVDSQIGVDPNDYATQNLQMVQGQTVSVTLSIDNQSVIFTFDIMNQTQYYIWYGCAPNCHQPLLGGNGTYYQQANESTPYLVNETVSPSTPFHSVFVAPSNGTYYFVFDNSIGNSWSTYVNHNASGYTDGEFALNEIRPSNVHSANWLVIGAGSATMLVGGAVGTAFWPISNSRPKYAATKLSGFSSWFVTSENQEKWNQRTAFIRKSCRMGYGSICRQAFASYSPIRFWSGCDYIDLDQHFGNSQAGDQY
jgi:hypothetical protein